MTRPELIEAMARAIYERVNGHGCRAWRQIDHKAAYRDQATAALAAIEAAGCVVVPGWRTMESAPKDGTEILCWCECCHPDPWGSGPVCAVFECSWDEWSDEWIVPLQGDGEGGWGNDFYWQPTHWMPLPAPPASPLAKDA